MIFHRVRNETEPISSRIWSLVIASISYDDKLHAKQASSFYSNDTIYQPIRSGRIWHKVDF